VCLRIRLALIRLLFLSILAYASGWCLPLPAWGQSKPLAPAEAPKHMTLPEGFHATLHGSQA
jgi:hypothetical protein